IVSDHHALEEDMQDNRAIYVHPAYSNLDYYVSGGIVAYYISLALLEKEDPYLHALAAITLISDVMPLEKGNRLFLRKALANMQSNNYLPIKSIATGFIDSSMIGSIIAPKINSLGRLPDLYNPNKLVRYFCSDNALEIKNFAKEIETCNNQRKDMTSAYFSSYSEVVPSNNFVMVEEEDLHEGLIGLLASRFANQYNCVCLVATKNEDGFKGSVRSIDGINAYEVFKKHSLLFEKFGGHAQAMGLSYNKENSSKINEALSNDFKKINICEKEYQVIDIKEEDLTIENIKSLRYLEPFGNEFEAPLFLLKNVLVAQVKHLKGNVHHRLSVLLEHKAVDVMVFNKSDLDIKVNDHVDMIVKLGVNEFYGKEKLNIIVEDYKIQ
ncbi:MAG: DHHA1 domain-containing protein, partial [Erysipelotrichales bacterium]